MKKAAFLFFRVEVGNAACAVQYLVVVQTMLVRCPKNLDFTVFQKVSLSNLIFRWPGVCPVLLGMFVTCRSVLLLANPVLRIALNVLGKTVKVVKGDHAVDKQIGYLAVHCAAANVVCNYA